MSFVPFTRKEKNFAIVDHILDSNIIVKHEDHVDFSD